MPTNRPNVTLRADEADALYGHLQALKTALESPQKGDTLEDWAPEIRRAYYYVSDAVREASARENARPVVRDTQRRKVYRAETLLDRDRPRLADANTQRFWLLTNVLRRDWFRARFPEVTEANVRVVKARGTTSSQYVWEYTGQPGGGHRLDLLPGTSDTTALHELAHACHRVWYGNKAAGHDANFVGILIWLAANALGQDAAIALARTMTVAGVKITAFRHQQRTVAPPKPVQLSALDPIMRIVRRNP